MNYTTLAAIIGSPLLYNTDKGEWVIDQFYRVDDIVDHDECYFRSKVEHISWAAKEPGLAPRYWELYGGPP